MMTPVSCLIVSWIDFSKFIWMSRGLVFVLIFHAIILSITFRMDWPIKKNNKFHFLMRFDRLKKMTQNYS